MKKYMTKLLSVTCLLVSPLISHAYDLGEITKNSNYLITHTKTGKCTELNQWPSGDIGLLQLRAKYSSPEYTVNYGDKCPEIAVGDVVGGDKIVNSGSGTQNVDQRGKNSTGTKNSNNTVDGNSNTQGDGSANGQKKTETTIQNNNNSGKN
jgi:hypothetical protein